jgi:hypothetical protein
VKSALWKPLALAAVLRLGLMIAAFVLTGTRVMTQGDTASYVEPGRNLFVHGAFTSGAFASGGLPETDRTPGYPIFAMLTGMLVGNVLLTVVAQIAVGLGSLVLVSRIAELVFPGRNAGVAAAWFFAVEPISVVYSVRLMPETLFVFLMLIAVERLLSFQARSNTAAIVAAGLALAAATYVRPASYYLVFPLAAGVAWLAQKNHNSRWKGPVLLLLTVLPCLAVWQTRNWIETGYSGFSSVVEKNLYFYQAAAVTATLDHTTLAAEQKKLGYPDRESYVAAHPEQRNWGEAERLGFMRSHAKSVLAQHPWLYLKSHFTGVAVVAFTPCAAELLELLDAYPSRSSMPGRVSDQGIDRSAMQIAMAHPGIALLMALFEMYLLLMYGLALRGLFTAGNTRGSVAMLVGIALYFLLISGGAQAVGRYRAPVMPIVCVLAAAGWRIKKYGGTEEAPPVLVRS